MIAVTVAVHHIPIVPSPIGNRNTIVGLITKLSIYVNFTARSDCIVAFKYATLYLVNPIAI